MKAVLGNELKTNEISPMKQRTPGKGVYQLSFPLYTKAEKVARRIKVLLLSFASKSNEIIFLKIFLDEQT